jgi:hypothetical protein
MTETNWGRHGTGMTPEEFRAWVAAGKPDPDGSWLAAAAARAMRDVQRAAWNEGWIAGPDAPNPYRSEQ